MSVMYVKINVIIVRQEIKINIDQIPKKNCPFLQIAFNFCDAFLRDAFLHVGSLRYAFLRAGSLRYAFLSVASLSYASLRAAS